MVIPMLPIDAQSDQDHRSQEGRDMTKVLVGNLSFQTTQADLEAAFGQFGTVERVEVVTERYSGQPRGFAFVEMTDRSATDAAITRQRLERPRDERE